MRLKFFFLFAHVRALEHFRPAGQHPDQALQRAELFHLAQLVQKILQRELPLAHFFLHAPGVVHVHRLGGALHQADDVAHAQNARGHALGVKRLEILQLFAHAGELDRLARDRLQTQRRAAARVAVQLGQDRAGDVAAPGRNAWRR